MNPTDLQTTKRLLVIAMASLLACESSPGWTAQAAGKPSPVISLCNKPFVFGFGTWKNARTEFLSKPDGKPNGPSRPLPFLYTISLKLPSPLKEGATYTIHLRGVNTSQENVSYVHQPRATRSLAVHAIQTGYRPDDPCKRAYLSFWMGVDKDVKNGSCTPDVDTFELVDALGKTVFTGRAELLKKEKQPEQICVHEKMDYTLAAVRRLDFSSFHKPGDYRVYVPGIGTSGPLRIAADVWEKPFKFAMQNVLTQRQGIELGPPACAYRRPRPFHPDDGVEFYQLKIPMQAGQEGPRGDNLVELAKAGSLKQIAGIWGGYQDAGDWDTLGHPLSATYDLLGLYFLNPAAFARTKLALPAEEMRNHLPDILDEALWQMPAWRRLQLPDGGVRGGYGYGWGCPNGVTSTMIRSAGVYAVDHETTMHYAAAAARAGRVLAVYDQKLAGEYLESAKRQPRCMPAPPAALNCLGPSSCPDSSRSAGTNHLCIARAVGPPSPGIPRWADPQAIG